jgi:hypothetical protein
MSRIKELRNTKENIINIVDALSLICPVGKESKYVDMFLRIMKNTNEIDSFAQEIKQHFNTKYGVPKEYFNEMTNLHIIFFYKFLETTFNNDDLETFHKFCKFNEKGLVAENDLSKYKSFEQVTKSVEIAEMGLLEKEMEKQIYKIYENDEWLVIRPLTFESSKKYGSNTKWCTTSETDSAYFKKYAGNGILIYNINKKNGKKVACYRSTNGETEFSFWNQKDERIDSLQSGLPRTILDVILNEIENNHFNNFHFNTDEVKNEELKSNKIRSRISRSIERITRETNLNEDEEDTNFGRLEINSDDEPELTQERVPVYEESIRGLNIFEENTNFDQLERELDIQPTEGALPDFEITETIEEITSDEFNEAVLKFNETVLRRNLREL